MFTNDLIDEKIEALLDYCNDVIDETNISDMVNYTEAREFAERYDGLLYSWDHEIYLVINFIGDENYLIIPIEYPL